MSIKQNFNIKELSKFWDYLSTELNAYKACLSQWNTGICLWKKLRNEINLHAHINAQKYIHNIYIYRNIHIMIHNIN